jgi:hypothetical protein
MGHAGQAVFSGLRSGCDGGLNRFFVKCIALNENGAHGHQVIHSLSVSRQQRDAVPLVEKHRRQAEADIAASTDQKK